MSDYKGAFTAPFFCLADGKGSVRHRIGMNIA